MTSRSPIRRPSRAEKAERTKRRKRKAAYLAACGVPQKREKRRRPGRLDAEGMQKLRTKAFYRAGGLCEARLAPDCWIFANWLTGELAHIKSRGAGGTDTLDNVLAVCQPCHRYSHDKGIKLRARG